MLKNKILVTICLTYLLFAPMSVLALSMPQNGSELANMSGISAEAYVVVNTETGKILAAKNEDAQRAAASLTKLITVLVVLDSKIKLTKVVSMTGADQTAGACSSGGACIKSKSGVKFTVDGLLHAALMPSANNAANALSRSIGLTPAQFAAKMNEKARSLGAFNTNFVEPTGLDPNNITTAADYAKIVVAAFNNASLKKIAGKEKYTLRSSNNDKYNQVIKNTNKLLGDKDLKIIGAKTGYLNESQYNFASLVQYQNGPKLAIVVLGENHLSSAFAETKLLASLAEQAESLAFLNQNLAVLGVGISANTQ